MATAKKANLLDDLRALDTKALTDKIAELKKELVDAVRTHKAGELPSTAAIRKTRRSIAKALTVLAEKAKDAAKELEK